MRNTDAFLLEIGTEELPPTQLSRLVNAMAEGVAKGLSKANLDIGTIKTFATPRRLALIIEDLPAQQPDREFEKRGPAWKAAYKPDGEPTPAAVGFANSCGIEASELQELKTDKGHWVVAQVKEVGKSIQTLMPEIIIEALAKLPIRKPMRWADYQIEFVRPVHWVVMLYGKHVIPATILGQETNNITFGHRFLHPQVMTIKHPNKYAQLLKNKGYVIADFNERKTFIHDEVSALAEKNGMNAVLENDLLDEVTGLVEWPVPLLAKFDEKFLQVPQEALIAAMRDHQKSFHVVDDSDNLLANFITVSNIESKDPDAVITGNERVMRARLADAAFFFEADRKRGLLSYLPRLKEVAYQAKLGTLHDKAERIAQLAQCIAGHINANTDYAHRAGMLAKCDLLSDMVGEFPELQGVMGLYYARVEGEPEEIAISIKEHYLPRFSQDELPSSDIGACLALADRLDTLVGIFGINQQPTGEKDPYGLRRAAVGIVRIIIEGQLDLDLATLLPEAIKGYEDKLENAQVLKEVHAFIIERMKAWYHDKSIGTDIIAAVLARQSSKLNDINQRVQAVKEFRQLESASALAAANKRVSNILRKEAGEVINNHIDSSLLQDAAERELAEKIRLKQEIVTPLFAEHKYAQALQELAELQPPVDRFFDDVMVMVDDEKLRRNRLALLASLRNLFLQIADISLLQ